MTYINDVEGKEAFKTDKIKYAMHLSSENTSDNPTVFLLHGFGSNEKALSEMSSFLPANFNLISLRAPHVNGSNSYRWFFFQRVDSKSKINEFEKEYSYQLIQETVQTLISKHHLNKDKIYIGGFSQGAMLAMELGLKNPNIYHKVVSISGRLFEHLNNESTPNEDNKKQQYLLVHGLADQMIESFESENLEKKLLDWAIPTKAIYYPNQAHSFNQNTLKDIATWLQEGEI